MCGNWTTDVVIELFGGYWTNKKKKLGFVNIVNTNTFFYSSENIVSKLRSYGFSQCNIWITQNVITGEGYNFLGTHFWRGQDFWAVNLRGGKIFGPSLLK